MRNLQIVHSEIFDLSPLDLQQLKTIFFTSSLKVQFSDAKEKDRFFYHWLGCYLEHPFESFLFLARSGVRGDIEGYCVGVKNSNDTRTWTPLQASDNGLIFEKYFKKFSSHIHINVAPETRGTGAGSQLILAVKAYLRQKEVYGLHIVTDPDSKNVSFYRKNGFHHEVVKSHGETRWLFMGCLL